MYANIIFVFNYVFIYICATNDLQRQYNLNQRLPRQTWPDFVPHVQTLSLSPILHFFSGDPTPKPTIFGGFVANTDP